VSEPFTAARREAIDAHRSRLDNGTVPKDLRADALFTASRHLSGEKLANACGFLKSSRRTRREIIAFIDRLEPGRTGYGKGRPQ